MRQTILTVFFENGTDILHDVEMSPSLRFLIVAQDIGQSIGECSDGESGVNGQRDVLSPRGETGGENKKNGGEMLHKKGLSWYYCREENKKCCFLSIFYFCLFYFCENNFNTQIMIYSLLTLLTGENLQLANQASQLGKSYYNFIVAGIIILIAAVAILFVVFAYIKSRKVLPKIITIKQPLHLVGYSVEAKSDRFVVDDDDLWERYRQRRATIQNRKESFSNLSVLKKTGEGTVKYFIGSIVNDFSVKEDDLEAVTVPMGLYVDIHIKANNKATWRKQRDKAYDYIMEKWIPESEYELDDKSEAMIMEYHDKRDVMNTRTVILYFALRKKSGIIEPKNEVEEEVAEEKEEA